ncbi:Hypothetical predicted protein [Olea europaea subsp. europaea]|uniref:Uncharacterized protein n=1 Tax=Olea europaea subsp. europaea TaxID=158383 RepID=A0A8S0VE73_OLEEU|nr:Hypothetical predicted protein [Olea europaea subsp. europaea]
MIGSTAEIIMTFWSGDGLFSSRGFSDMGQLGGMEHEEEEMHKLEEGTQDKLGEDARGVDFQIPTCPTTRARSKKLQESLQGLVGHALEEETKSKAISNELGLQVETKFINLIQVQSSEDPITLG